MKMMLNNKKKMSHYRDIETIKLLFYISNVLCLLPRYNFVKEKCIKSKFYDLYAILIALINSTFGLLACYYRIRDVYSTMEPTTIVVDFIANILLTIMCGIMILRLSLWKSDELNVLLQSVTIYNKRSNIKSYKKCGKNYFYTELFAYHLLYVAFVLLDAYVWISSLGFKIFRHYLFRNVQYYYIITLSFIMFNVALIIRDRFVHLNERLECNVTLAYSITIVREVGYKRGVHRWRENNGVKDINKLYISLCEIVEKYNQVFGPIIVIMSVIFIIGLLQPINIGLVYTTTDMDGATFGVDLGILCVLWSSIYIVCGWTIASSCDDAMKKGKETSFLCYKLIAELNNCGDHQYIKEDLVLLSNLINNHLPTFNAAGFFTVNFKTLVSMIGSVTAYIVVLIQFKN